MLSHLLRFLPLVALALASPVQSQSVLANGDVREISLSLPEGTRVEYFRLDLPVEGPRQPLPVGVARWISGPIRGLWRTELEIQFFADNTRVVHTEHLGRDRRELVFRELRARSGRTVRFVWTADQKGVCTDTSGGEIRRREMDLTGGGALPLSLVDVVRRGGTWNGSVDVFEPVAASFARMTPMVRTATAETDDAASERVLDLWRADGLRAGSYRFIGEELVSFAWQAGGPRATAVPVEEYEQWRGENNRLRGEHDR